MTRPGQDPAVFRGGSGAQVLLLHGFTGTWRHWSPVVHELADRFEVIAPTLAGHAGGPPFPIGEGPLMAQAVRHLEGHLDELGVTTEAHVVGNSLGGALALELAKRGRIRSVLAIAPGGGWSPGDGAARAVARLFTRQIAASRLVRARAEVVMSRPSTRRVALRDVMRRGDRLTAQEAVDLLQTSLQCEVIAPVIRALRADEDVVVRDLEQIRVPVLLASPQHDRILPPQRHTARYLAQIPGVEHVFLPRTGHVPMWDDPALVVRTVTEWVGRHDQQSRRSA